ncbi:ATP-binding protein [Leptolyngbya sp. FACHB-261]|uniref:PAS domain-containing sensor histidine kinase n=1 Tax=Leptolyngbya sp. FACHB-261 TaxID=2692806 RepID=UPI00168551DD|nr:ATP-binding protein [Leptolyngbya sp. FACHB-261]MBD2099476.1 PAS domain S-box protein [Leptolyngbya sp. FACHB-261]
MRTSEQIWLEIEAYLGFVPPFFEPAQQNPQVLENLWQQTLLAYLQSPLPTLFKEKLSAYLSRYCTVPYCLICHSCSLRPLGMSAQAVLALLQAPPPLPVEIEQHLALLAEIPGALSRWPETDSVLEESLLACSIFVAMESTEADHCRNRLRDLLGPVNYQHLAIFIAYIKTCHGWMEAHPEITYEADQRAQKHLGPLFAMEPSLADFFRTYRDWVKREQLNRTEQLAELNEALRKSEAKNRAILNAIPDLMLRLSRDGTYLEFKRSKEFDMLLPDDQVVSSNEYDVLPHELARTRMHYVEQALLTGETQIFEYEILLSGTIRYEEARIVVSGEDEVLAIIRNIDDRKQAEVQTRLLHTELEQRVCERTAALAASEEKFRQLAENIRQVFFLKSVDGTQLYVSPAYEEVWGRTCKSLYEQPDSWLETIHPDDRQGVLSTFKSELGAKGKLNLEYRIVRPDGDVRWIGAHSFAIRNETGQLERIAGIAEDITERKRAEAELRSSEERFRISVENLLDCFGIYAAIRDPSGQIVDFRVEYVNAAACVHNGLSREQQVGMRLLQLFPSHREMGLFDDYCQVVETGQSLVKEALVYRDVYGNPCLTRSFDVNATKLGDGFAVAWRDTTERNRTEALKQANRELQQANTNLTRLEKLKSEMVAAVSHEIRMPITTIATAVSVLRSSVSLEPRNREILEIANSESLRLTRLVDELLNFSKLDSGTYRWHEEAVDLNRVLCQAIQATRALYESRALSLQRPLAEPQVQVWGDADRLAQVVINLLDNAAKFSPSQSQVCLELSIEGKEIEAQEAVVAVRDQGPGIAAEHQELIFELFSQLPQASGNRPQGVGLGLYLCRKIVYHHGGRITVETELEQGSTFKVRLPLLSTKP